MAHVLVACAFAHMICVPASAMLISLAGILGSFSVTFLMSGLVLEDMVAVHVHQRTSNTSFLIIRAILSPTVCAIGVCCVSWATGIVHSSLGHLLIPSLLCHKTLS